MPSTTCRLITSLAMFLCVGVALAPFEVDAQIEVPITDLGWLVVPVYLNDEPVPLRFVLDTGASWTAVSAATARRFSRGAIHEIQVQGASGLSVAHLATVPAIRVGEFRIADRDVLVLEDQELVSDDQEFDGILGADILSRFDVLIDAPSGRLRLYPHGAEPTTLAAELLSAAIPIELIGGRLIHHSVTVNGATMEALLDSGARRMLVNRAASAAAGIDVLSGSARVDSPGLGSDEFEFHSGSLGDLVVAGASFPGLRTLVGDLPVLSALGIQAAPLLIIGAPLLARCPVFIAYSSRTIRYCRRPASPTN